jgi:hypothetical protein
MAKAYTRSSAGKYETALMEFIPKDSKEWTSLHVELLTAAGTIDNLTADIIRDSKSLSEKFARYAEEVELRGEGWDPMGYSSLRDLDLNVERIGVHKEYFHNLLRMTFGPNAHKTFVKALAA